MHPLVEITVYGVILSIGAYSGLALVVLAVEALVQRFRGRE